MNTGRAESRSGHRPALNASLNRRLIGYATAATAAGAGLLGLARPAGAEVVYTPAQVLIGYRGSYALDVTNDGTVDFLLHDAISSNCSTVFNALLAQVAPGNAVVGNRSFGGANYAAAMKGGARIGPSDRFVSQGRGGEEMAEGIDSPGGGQVRGQWGNVTNRYLGLKFQINGETHFGWARLNVRANSRSVVAVLTGYAYETVAGMPILAGQTQGGAQPEGARPDAAVKGASDADAFVIELAKPGSETSRVASLGMLALGAEALPMWRRDPSTTRR